MRGNSTKQNSDTFAHRYGSVCLLEVMYYEIYSRTWHLCPIFTTCVRMHTPGSPEHRCLVTEQLHKSKNRAKSGIWKSTDEMKLSLQACIWALATMHKGERIGHTPRLLLKELHMLHCYANFICCLLTAPPPSTPLHCPNLHDLDYSMSSEIIILIHSFKMSSIQGERHAAEWSFSIVLPLSLPEASQKLDEWSLH